MDILIYGGGAVGLGIASCLLKAGHQVDILARPGAVVLLNTVGLLREGIFGDYRALPGELQAVSALQQLDGHGYDYILICTKSFDSQAAARDLADYPSLSRSRGLIVLFQNGWGNAEAFLPFFPREKIFNARVITGFTLPAANRVKITVHAAAIHLGSLFGADQAGLAPLARGITAGGIETLVVEEITGDLWAKMLYNCALNATGALFGVAYGVLAGHAESRAIMQSIIGETFAVMQAAGYSTHWATAAEFQEAFYEQQIPPTAEHKSSTLQDLAAGKRTEIDALNGAVARLGKELGVPTPVNMLLTRMVKFKQALARRVEVSHTEKEFQAREETMKRIGFAMQLKPGKKEEYKRRHDRIWPELVAALQQAGVRDYVIYLDERTHTLYASQKVTEPDTSADLKKLPIVKKWWKMMADLMETNPDKSPVVYDLQEMFYMD